MDCSCLLSPLSALYALAVSNPYFAAAALGGLGGLILGVGAGSRAS